MDVFAGEPCPLTMLSAVATSMLPVDTTPAETRLPYLAPLSVSAALVHEPILPVKLSAVEKGETSQPIDTEPVASPFAAPFSLPVQSTLPASPDLAVESSVPAVVEPVAVSTPTTESLDQLSVPSRYAMNRGRSVELLNISNANLITSSSTAHLTNRLID